MNKQLIWPAIIDLAQPGPPLPPAKNHRVRNPITPVTPATNPVQGPEVPLDTTVHCKSLKDEWRTDLTNCYRFGSAE